MTLTEATRLGRQEAHKNGMSQSIVLLDELSHGRLSYIPIASRSASGLRGKVVSELKPA